MKYRNPNLPLEERIEDLLSHMTLEEKASQLLHESPAIERLGVPEYNWWNECLHGVARAGKATVFPQAIALGATFNPDLAFEVAEAISTEGRAKFNEAVRNNQRGRYQGLTFWTPNINIFRDPRWGRGQETYGEDPFLTAAIGTAFVKGIQGDHPAYMKAAACAKHFAVHSGPEGLRHEFDARVSEKDLRETYLPAFKALVDAGVEAVMGAYNRTNGEPCCASETLMNTILRGEWQFQGHYVSDCWAIGDFHTNHKVTSTPEESAALGVRTGCDLNCGCVYESLVAAVEQGLLEEADIDRSLRRLLSARFRLGLFDPPEMVPWSSVPMSVVGCDTHRALAREVAQQSCVLLKNNGVLPLKSDVRKLFVTGPAAADHTVLLSNYHGTSTRLVSFLDGITERAGDDRWVVYRQGCGFDTPVRNKLNYSFNEAKDHDIVIACLGISSYLEGEEGDAFASDFKGDKRTLALPEDQVDYCRKIKKAGAPLVVVVTGGSPIDLTEIHELADAVVFAWYPGEEGGNALASLLFGDVSPSGRLPITFPKSLEQLPPFEEYAMKGRTYRYMTETPLYPFGFGLSYGDIRYESLQQVDAASGMAWDMAAAAGGHDTDVLHGVDLVVTLRNAGSTGVSEVVQTYVALAHNDGSQPISRLVSVDRVWIGPGETVKTAVSLPSGAFETVDDDGVSRSRQGEWNIIVGGSSPGTRSQELGAPAPVSLTVER